MDDVKLRSLSQRLGSRWTKEREAAVLERIGRRRARPLMPLGRTFTVAAAAAVVAFGIGRWGRSSRPEVVQMPALPAPARVIPLVADTKLESSEPGGRGYVLQAGSARFEVTHDATHPFHVHARGFLIEDMGTVFTVGLAASHGVEVGVQEGTVRIISDENAADIATLHAGEFRTFEAKGVDTRPWATVEQSPSATPPERQKPAPSTSDGSSSSFPPWRRLAEAGHFDEAFAAIGRAGPNTVRDEVDELLLAADAARMSDHPSEATSYLNRVVESHSEDSRAKLAAFTLGRLYLEQLGRPLDAAREFAKVRETPGPLSEDALAHEVEAWSRAGDKQRARALALEYRNVYPDGAHGKAVAGFGGIE